MPLPLSERGPSPAKPPAKPTRSSTPSPGPRFDPSAVSDARELLHQALYPAAASSADPANPVYNPDTFGALSLRTNSEFDPDTYGTPSFRPNEEQATKAEDMLMQALREQREQALGAQQGAGIHKPIAPQVDRMTPEEYQALPPLERAAVDFNGMLVQAVRKDRRNQDEYTPTPQQQEIYDLSVEKIFGEDGGSKMYAPETLGLLRQIDFKDSSADLDDFLGLKAAVDKKDLASLERSSTPPAVTGGVAADSQVSDVAFDNVALARNLAESTQSMQTALVRGNELLQSLGAMARVERSNDVARNLGGLPNHVNTMLGYGAAADANGDLTVDGYFQRSFDLLAQKKSDRDSIFAAMNADLSPEEFKAFQTYAANRASQAEQHSLELGVGEGVKYRKPEEFRELLGTAKEGSDGSR